MPRLFALAVIAPLFVSAGPGAAQEKKDPQSAVEPRSAPGNGQRFLKKFVGDWEVVKTFHPKSGEPFRVTGACKQTMIHGGRFLQSDFVFRSSAGESTGTGLIGFEAATGKYTSVWVDSRATRMSFRQGKDSFDGNEIVLYSESLARTGAAPEVRPSRTVTRLEDAGNRIVHRQYSLAAEGPGRLVMEMVLTRKRETPATQP